MGVAESLALASGLFWWLSALASFRRVRNAYDHLRPGATVREIVSATFDLRRVARGEAPANSDRFTFGGQTPEFLARNAAADAYAALTNAAAALLAFAGAIALAIAAFVEA